MKSRTELSAMVLVFILLLQFFASTAEIDERENAQHEYVIRLVKLLASEDPVERERATKQLKATLPLSLDYLRQTLDGLKDEGQRSRLSELLNRYAPPRKQLSEDEVHSARDIGSRKKLIEKLFKEYVAEEKRAAELRSRQIITELNSIKILRDMAKLMPAGLPQLWDIPQEIVQVGNGRTKDLPRDIIEPVARLFRAEERIDKERELSHDLLEKLKSTEVLISSEKPPDLKDWEHLRTTLRDTVDLLHFLANERSAEPRVSMVFQGLPLLDILPEIAKQTGEFLFFDPPELRDTLLNSEISYRLEYLTWRQALSVILPPLGLTYTYQKTGEPGIHISKKEK